MGTGRRRRNQLRIAGVTAGVLAFVVLLVHWNQPPDPSYKGKKLSRHLLDPYRISPYQVHTQAEVERNNREHQLSQEALREVGTNALPLLERWLEREPFTMQVRLNEQLAKRKIHWPMLTDRRRVALRAVLDFPERCAPLAPALIRLLDSGDRAARGDSALALWLILSQAPKQERVFVAKKLERTVSEMIEAAAAGVDKYAIGSELLAAVYDVCPPADIEGTLQRLKGLKNQQLYDAVKKILSPDGKLIALLDLKGNIQEQIRGARYFRENPVQPERVVPMLIECLKSEDTFLLQTSAATLGAYGTNALAAVPSLTNLYQHPYPWVSSAAAVAVRQIEQNK